MQFVFAQEKTVTGVVSDASGPLPGANVLVKGTARGTQDRWEVFSRMENKLVTVGASIINIRMLKS
jgi:hypothetical protein